MARTSTFPKDYPDENEEADARDYSLMMQPRTMENSSGRIPPSFPPPSISPSGDPRLAAIQQMMQAQQGPPVQMAQHSQSYRGGGARNPPDPAAQELMRQGSRGAGDQGRAMLGPDEQLLGHVSDNIGGKQQNPEDVHPNQWPPTPEGFKKMFGRDPASDAEMEHYYKDPGQDDDADDATRGRR